ncbi:MAG: hypothetical protein KF748_06560 [Xanthobacteraceae bacterium]|nr:hypothetical protein [Xanthobacteraceae bacterium]
MRDYISSLLRPKKIVNAALFMLAIGFAYAGHSLTILHRFPEYGRIVCYAGVFLCLGASALTKYLPD